MSHEKGKSGTVYFDRSGRCDPDLFGSHLCASDPSRGRNNCTVSQGPNQLGLGRVLWCAGCVVYVEEREQDEITSIHEIASILFKMCMLSASQLKKRLWFVHYHTESIRKERSVQNG